MSQNSFFSIFLLAAILMGSSNSIAGNFHRSAVVASHKIKDIIITDEQRMGNKPKQTEPVTKEEDPVKKSHTMKTEELAHIHHFHKERVKKLKRHHKKFWILSKTLLILCHLLLLVCAFQHLANA